MRQAFAGMLWSKQFYCYDVTKWLEDVARPATTTPELVADRKWIGRLCMTMRSFRCRTVEDPWFAAWDLAFHCYSLLAVHRLDLPNSQLDLLACEWLFLIPTGRFPAYEWNFGNVNPPVHGMGHDLADLPDRAERYPCAADLEFLERIFDKLLLELRLVGKPQRSNGSNVFEGGFLGSTISASSTVVRPLPTGGISGAGRRHSVDGGCYSPNMMKIAVELASTRRRRMRSSPRSSSVSTSC